MPESHCPWHWGLEDGHFEDVYIEWKMLMGFDPDFSSMCTHTKSTAKTHI
jgi:hypothetical protein